MAWTEERVEILKKLWAEGLSASQIANRLGGVTRNAVIGKVHRLGLSGRVTTPRIKSIHTRKRSARPAQRNARKPFRVPGSATVKAFQPPLEARRPAPAPRFEELVIPADERATLLTLKECDCRWPIGDPQDEDFHFCGRKKLPGLPYCEYHARVAFQPVAPRRREREPERRAISA